MSGVCATMLIWVKSRTESYGSLLSARVDRVRRHVDEVNRVTVGGPFATTSAAIVVPALGGYRRECAPSALVKC